MPSVELKDVRKHYGDFEAIRGVDLTINDREFVVFVGPSGCGKSTLLRMIAGLEEISGGDVLIEDERVNDVPAPKRQLAMVFQSYALYPHMTVAENMGFSLRLAGVSKAERDEQVRRVARILRLEELLARKPAMLSGGQRQRVAIGRAIVREPKVFLFDEPLSNLDAALRIDMRLELLRLHERLQATMVYVTHDQIEAMTMADKIVVLRDGVIEQAGTPLELYHHPANLFVAGFIGSPRMNFVEVAVADRDDQGVRVRLPGGAEVPVPVDQRAAGAPGTSLTLGVRPERIRLDPDGPIRGEIQIVERLGGATYLHIEAEGGMTLVIETDGETEAEPHSRIAFALDGQYCQLFGADGAALPRLARHRLAERERSRGPRVARAPE